jgi:ubiquinone/menaquinone biosynthesis C-methylase UbiE
MTSQNPTNSGDRVTDLAVRLIEGSWISQAINVVVSLGIPDLLRDGPRPSEELAAETGAHAQSLHRIMRALAGEGLFNFDDAGRFSLTPAGAVLRSDVPNSLHHWALLMLGEVHQGAWGELIHTARTGESAFRHRFGVDLWQYCAGHAEHARLFAAAMAGFTTTYVKDLLSSYSFAAFKRIVDVGGGDGSLLIEILQANHGIRGTVFDLPAVIARAEQRIHEAGLAARCVASGGDALVEVPRGGDAYILSRMIHDWDDYNAEKILVNCRRVLAAGGRILVIERAMPYGAKERASVPGSVLSDINMTDLNMMVMTSGRERTVGEYQSLFARAGLELIRVIPTRTAMNVLEAGERRGAAGMSVVG